MYVYTRWGSQLELKESSSKYQFPSDNNRGQRHILVQPFSINFFSPCMHILGYYTPHYVELGRFKENFRTVEQFKFYFDLPIYIRFAFDALVPTSVLTCTHHFYTKSLIIIAFVNHFYVRAQSLVFLILFRKLG